MSFKAKEWINQVYDDGGNILRKGTPIMAEDMNKIENELENLSSKQPGIKDKLDNHENKISSNEEEIDTLDRRVLDTEKGINSVNTSLGEANGIATLNESGVVPSTQLPSNLKEIKVVPTLAERDSLEKFEGLRIMVLDASSDETVNSGWAEYVWSGVEFIKVAEAEGIDLVIEWEDVVNKPVEYNPKKHSHTESDISDLDKYTKQEVNTRLEGKSPVGHEHSEVDIQDLDKYTKQEVEDLLNEKAGKNELHSHNNKTVLDKVTQGTLDKIVENEGRIDDLEEGSSLQHSHSNKVALDKLRYTGAKPSLDLLLLDELENHTHDYNKLRGTPTIPSKISQLADDSEFIKGNTGRITVSSTQPSNMQENDIWIKVV